MKSTLLLLIAIVALAATAVWIGLISSDQKGLASPEIRATTPNASSGEAAKSPALETPKPAAPDSETPPAGAVNERAQVAVEKVDFAAKYANWSVERLEGAKAVLNASLMESSNRILDERTKQGLFEELVLQEGAATPPQHGIARDYAESAGPGLVRHRITELPLEEYPALQSLKDEVDWLNARTWELAHPKKP
jgi:hypothetical protein